MWLWTAARRQVLLATVLLLPLCYQARPKPVGRIEKTFFPRDNFWRQVFCSFLSVPMCGKSRKQSFNTEVIVDFSISRAWTPHAIFLSDRNDPLWECWYNLSNLTNQRVYQELVYRNGSFKEMITGSAAPSLPSFLPFYLRLRALSIQRAQLSRSLEQAISTRTTNSVRSILGSQYSISNPTLSHVQLFENHIKRARLLFFWNKFSVPIWSPWEPNLTHRRQLSLREGESEFLPLLVFFSVFSE